MTDLDLLDQFVRTGSASAFAEVVARHLDWVYGVARLAVRGDPHLAEDVTQATFIVLARKAATIPPGTVLAAWLFRVTRYTAAAALRAEARRRRHEGRYAALRERETLPMTNFDARADWQCLSPILDDLVARLSRDDRRAVLLRFYRRKSFRAVGEALGVSEEAARKRVGRAVDNLRAKFARRGLTVPAVATLAGALLDYTTTPPPAALAAKAATESLSAALGLAASHATAAGPAALAKGAMHMMAWTQTKFAAAVIAGATLLGGTGAWVSTRVLATDGPAAASNPVPSPAAAAPASAPADRDKQSGAALDRRIPEVNFRSVPLTDALTFLRDVSGAEIDVDWAGLQPLGVSRDAKIDLSAKGETFGQVLRRAFTAAGAKDPVRVRAAADAARVSVDAPPKDAGPARADKGGDGAGAAAGNVLERKLPEVSFRQVAFSDVIDFLRDVSGTDVVVDWPSLRPLGVSRDAKIDLRMKNVTFEKALRAAFTAAGAAKPVRIGLDDAKVVVDAAKRDGP